MNGKLTNLLLLGALILTSCGGQTGGETATPAVADTQVVANTPGSATQPPVATEPPALTAEASATSTNLPSPTVLVEPRPTNVAGCTNSAAFVADVTIPDNTQIDGGAQFVKTWRIMNNGTCIWASDYKLTYYSEERMNAPAEVPLAITYPGQTLDISVTLTAPNSIGKHRGNFVIKNAEGLIMKVADDSRLWLIINVGTTITATVANTATAAPQSAVTPTGTTSASGAGFATVTCGFSDDRNKVLEVINGVNAYRTQSGLPAYPVNPQLASAAQAHARDMACNNLFVHTGSNGSTVASRVAASGYVAAFVSENVYGSNPPLSGQEAVNWWRNDKTDLQHNLNLISDTFTEFGVGYAFFNNFGYYVIVFASP